MKNKNKKIVIRLVFLLILYVLTVPFGACGSNSAQPTASLPLPPLEGPITVSSPDAQGYVTVTGGAGAVPNDAIVIIGVESDSSSAFLYNIEGCFINEANAATCSSDLPECPSVSADDECQYQAESDGGFSLQVPATTSDNISVSYLDPDTCELVNVGTTSVDANVIPLSLDVTDIVFEKVSRHAFILGDDETTGSAVLYRYDIDENEGMFVDFDLTGEAQEIKTFQDHNGDAYLIATTSAGTQITVVDTDGSLSDFKTIVNSSETPITGLHFLDAAIVDYDDTYDTCVSDFITNDEGTATKYTRLIFADEEFFKVIEFEESIEDVDPDKITDDGDLIARSLDLYLSDESSLFSGDVDLFEVLRLEASSEELDLLFKMQIASSSYYVALRHVNYYHFCDSSMTFAFDDSDQYVSLGTASTGGINTQFNHNLDNHMILPFLKIDEQELMIVDFSSDSGGIVCRTDGGVLLSDSGTATSNGCDALYETNEVADIFSGSYDVGVDDVAMTYLFMYSSSVLEMFFLGSDGGGYNFLVPGGESVSLKDTDAYISTIDPEGMAVDEAGHTLVIIDSGYDGDNRSNMIIYEMAGTLTN